MKVKKVKMFLTEFVIDSVFAIDFLINENIILEINGPYHFFRVYAMEEDDRLAEIIKLSKK